MSYARFGSDSNVYVFQSCDLELVCYGCQLDSKDPRFTTARTALDHLEKHIEAGHKVPDYTIAQIKEDFPDLDSPLENE